MPQIPFIMVDGGINEDTITEAVQAGANVIVSGSSIFGENRRTSMGIQPIKNALEKLSLVLKNHGK